MLSHSGFFGSPNRVSAGKTVVNCFHKRCPTKQGDIDCECTEQAVATIRLGLAHSGSCDIMINSNIFLKHSRYVSLGTLAPLTPCFSYLAS